MLPLEGIRVIDLTQAEFGPRATMHLADMGADVIKIEPRQGEYTRPVTRFYDSRGINCYFWSHNRNKRGIALDFTKDKGKEIIYKLVERSDVFVTTYAPGTMERHGLGYETLKKYNPKLIYCRGSCFGPKGPWSGRRGYDIIAQALSGLMHQVGLNESEVATPAGTAVVDQAGALAMAFGIMVALYVRERTGKGQEIDCSLLGTAFYMLSLELVCYLVSGKLPPKADRGHGVATGLYYTFPTKDRWIAIGGVRNEPWEAMCRAMGLEHLIEDPRFATTDDREVNRAELIPILDEKFRTKTAKEWMELLDQAGAIAAPVYNLGEALADPELKEQLVANEYLVEMDAPDGGKIEVVGPIVHLSETPGKVRRGGFQVGEHNHEILLELGYTWEEIAQLYSEEVL